MLATEHRARLDEKIIAIAIAIAMAGDGEFTALTRRLACLRGIATLTGFALAVGIGDCDRFTGASIGAYLGLVPSEHSCPVQPGCRGPIITKTGNTHVRRLLVEAAWHHRAPYRPSTVLQRRPDQAPAAARARGHAGTDVPVGDHISDNGHGRIETRSLKLTAIATGIGSSRRPARRPADPTPHPQGQQPPLAVRDRPRDHRPDPGADNTPPSRPTRYGPTGAPENRLHWVRDVTFAEDLSQIRTGGPAIMAKLPNLAIRPAPAGGANNIAAACRTVSRHPARALDMIT